MIPTICFNIFHSKFLQILTLKKYHIFTAANFGRFWPHKTFDHPRPRGFCYRVETSVEFLAYGISGCEERCTNHSFRMFSGVVKRCQSRSIVPNHLRSSKSLCKQFHLLYLHYTSYFGKVILKFFITICRRSMSMSMASPFCVPVMYNWVPDRQSNSLGMSFVARCCCHHFWLNKLNRFLLDCQGMATCRSKRWGCGEMQRRLFRYVISPVSAEIRTGHLFVTCLTWGQNLGLKSAKIWVQNVCSSLLSLLIQV